MKIALLVMSIGLCSAALADTASSPETAPRPVQVRKIIGVIRTCLYSQAQRMVDQINGSSRVKIKPLWSLTKSARNDTSYEIDLGGDDREINPTGDYVGDDLTLSAGWGKCDTNTYGQILVQSDDSLAVQYEKVQPDCGTDDPPDLVTEKGVMPKLLYKAANRSKVFDRTGNERFADETITSLQLADGNAPDPAKVQLYNSDTGHTTDVFFNADAYKSCLKEKLF